MLLAEQKSWDVYLGLKAPAFDQRTVPSGRQIRDGSGLEFVILEPQGSDSMAAVQDGVNMVLHATTSAPSSEAVVTLLDPVLERILNMLSFRALSLFRSIALEIRDKEGASFFLPAYTPIGEGRFKYLGFTAKGGVTFPFIVEPNSPLKKSQPI